MKKDEAELRIRQLCHVWKQECFPDASEQDLRFSAFYDWLQQNDRQSLTFRSVMGPREDAERWFDQEFHQTWRN